MTTTANLGLKKPDYTDNADIAVISDNFEKIDAEIGKKANQTALNTTNANVAKAQATADRFFALNPYLNKATFTTSGTWICPAGVTRVGVFMRDGGQGGTGTSFVQPTTYDGPKGSTGSGRASAGTHTTFENVAVTPGQAYLIIVGAGGVGGDVSALPFGTANGLGGGKSGAFGLATTTASPFRGGFSADTIWFAGRSDNTMWSLEILNIGEYSMVNLTGSGTQAYQTSVKCNGFKFNPYTMAEITSNGGYAQFAQQYTRKNGQPGGNGVVEIYY